MEDENIAGIYREQIMSAETGAGKILATFFWSVTGREYSLEDVLLFNRLTKVYGRKIVFDSILDVINIKNLTGNVGALMSTLCKKNFNAGVTIPARVFDSSDIKKRLVKAQKRANK